MNRRIEELVLRIKELEKELSLELEAEMTAIRKNLSYSLEQGKIRFQQKAIAAQKALRKDLYHYVIDSNILIIFSAPVIYSLIVPLLLLDLFTTTYQYVCFPIYGMRKVARRDYFIIDRQHLAYLNLIEKVNCMYCGYGNGLLSYCLEIASRTEAFWCPIKHARTPKDAHSRYQLFSEYGDAKGYREQLLQMRTEME